jgi:hypothetical protein
LCEKDATDYGTLETNVTAGSSPGQARRWPIGECYPVAGYPVAAIPRASKWPRSFFRPSRIRPFTVPSGNPRRSAISTCV